MVYLKYMQKLLLIVALSLIFTVTVQASTFKVATYNVENLFDLNYDNREYPEYIPNTGFRWNSKTFNAKIKNLSRVIKDLNADILALQEIESEEALLMLRKELDQDGINYKHYAICSDDRRTPVRTAILSKFPIVEKEEIKIIGVFRDILKVTVNIEENNLILFINHWKSKRSPESSRVKYAAELNSKIRQLVKNDDYIILGDLNSNYNEYKTFRKKRKLNDTEGQTGINHILRTLNSDRLVTEREITQSSRVTYLYNLWLEIPYDKRCSYIFIGRCGTPDNMIIPKSLYDKYGISYVDNSFNVFNPDYLFKDNSIYRWERAKSGKSYHIGRGFSDHLPIYAYFSTQPFQYKKNSKLEDSNKLYKTTIAGLYKVNTGNVNLYIRGCAVIYINDDSAVIKQENGRAIFLYKCAENLRYNYVYDLIVKKVINYNGLIEVTKITDVKRKSKVNTLEKCFLKYSPDLNLEDIKYQNEILDNLAGIYNKGYFYYDKNRKIKIYFKDKKLKPGDNNISLTIDKARIGYHYKPEIIIEKASQIEFNK